MNVIFVVVWSIILFVYLGASKFVELFSNSFLFIFKYIKFIYLLIINKFTFILIPNSENYSNPYYLLFERIFIFKCDKVIVREVIYSDILLARGGKIQEENDMEIGQDYFLAKDFRDLDEFNNVLKNCWKFEVLYLKDNKILYKSSGQPLYFIEKFYALLFSFSFPWKFRILDKREEFPKYEYMTVRKGKASWFIEPRYLELIIKEV